MSFAPGLIFELSDLVSGLQIAYVMLNIPVRGSDFAKLGIFRQTRSIFANDAQFLESLEWCFLFSLRRFKKQSRKGIHNQSFRNMLESSIFGADGQKDIRNRGREHYPSFAN